MNQLLDTDRKNIWHPFTSLSDAEAPILIDSANGIYLHTTDGRKIIDAVSSWWVNIHGHANSFIADAIADQAKNIEHVIFAGFTHRPAIDLSENLLSILPSNQRKIFFSDNGSTAVEVALKMSIQYWHNQGIHRRKIIAIDGAYHGDTFGAMSVGERGLFTDPFSSYLFDVGFIDFPHPGTEQKVFEQFKHLADDPSTAAFIFEPLIQGASGMRIYSTSLLDEMVQYAQSRGIVCIADEVFTGFCRTGRYFASNYLASAPDIMAVSKGITGGFLPLGVTSCSEHILKPFKSPDAVKTFYHGHSYTANPLSCAAANASFKLLTNEKCQERIKEITTQQLSFAKSLTHRNVRRARALGTILSIELESNESTSYINPIRKKIYPWFLERNILMRPLGNVIYVLPPYVITNEELRHIHHTIMEFLDSY